MIRTHSGSRRLERGDQCVFITGPSRFPSLPLAIVLRNRGPALLAVVEACGAMLDAMPASWLVTLQVTAYSEAGFSRPG